MLWRCCAFPFSRIGKYIMYTHLGYLIGQSGSSATVQHDASIYFGSFSRKTQESLCRHRKGFWKNSVKDECGAHVLLIAPPKRRRFYRQQTIAHERSFLKHFALFVQHVECPNFIFTFTVSRFYWECLKVISHACLKQILCEPEGLIRHFRLWKFNQQSNLHSDGVVENVRADNKSIQNI